MGQNRASRFALTPSSTSFASWAVSGSSAAYLLGLEKEYKPSGVFIDDPKGLFILRWYREVGANGKALAKHKYQQVGCKAYELIYSRQ